MNKKATGFYLQRHPTPISGVDHFIIFLFHPNQGYSGSAPLISVSIY